MLGRVNRANCEHIVKQQNVNIHFSLRYAKKILWISYQSRIQTTRDVRRSRVWELAESDSWRSFRHRVVQVSAAPPCPCPLRGREAPSNHRVGASQTIQILNKGDYYIMKINQVRL